MYKPDNREANACLVSLSHPRQRCVVDFIGCFTNDSFLVSMPADPVAQYWINEGKLFQLRISHENVVYAFNTRISKICSQPYICLRMINVSKINPANPVDWKYVINRIAS